MLKKLSEMYGGVVSTIREHLLFDTPLAKYMYETTSIPNTNFKTNGIHIPNREDYEGYVGELINREDLPVFVNGTAEMMAKILLIRNLGLSEDEVYSCETIQGAVAKLNEYMHTLSWSELRRLINGVGQENIRALNDRLDTGYIRSFTKYEDGVMGRALWLFALMRFHKYKEMKWFSFLGSLANADIKRDIRDLSERTCGALLALAKGQYVDIFPQYGETGNLTVMGDIQIGDSLILISGLDKNQWNNDTFYRSAVILNACHNLSDDNCRPMIKNKMIYHTRWNAFTRVI